MAEIKAIQLSEETKEENIDYIEVSFQGWDIYIWGCQKFTPFLTNDGGSVAKRIAAQAEDYLEGKKEKANLSTKKKPMSERIKGRTEVELKEMANRNLMELMEIIDLNKIEEQMKNGLQIEEHELPDETEYKGGSPLLTEVMSKTQNTHSKVESENWIHFWSEGRIHESLLIRKKGQHLNRAQIDHIIQLLHRFPRSRGCLQKMYRLSLATLKRISKQISIFEPYHNRFLVKAGAQRVISEEAKQLIHSYLSPPWGPRSISMVKDYLESKLREEYPLHKIRSYVKREMEFAYKKGSSRPPVYATMRSQLVKALFWTELLLLMAKGEIIINLDESSFDRSVKRQFSWLPVGRSYPIINDKLKGRASLILATWNTGEWISMVVLDTVDSEKFWFFLELLKVTISNNNSDITKPPIIILDNARTHSSIKTINKIKDLDLQIRFLAPYWPEIAPLKEHSGGLNPNWGCWEERWILILEREKESS